jgi:hypothetical protein
MIITLTIITISLAAKLCDIKPQKDSYTTYEDNEE